MVVPFAWTAHVLAVSAAIWTVVDTPGTPIGVSVFVVVIEPSDHCPSGGGPPAQPQQEVLPASLKAQACRSPSASPAMPDREGTGCAVGPQTAASVLHEEPWRNDVPAQATPVASTPQT